MCVPCVAGTYSLPGSYECLSCAPGWLSGNACDSLSVSTCAVTVAVSLATVGFPLARSV
jgi:hypothetical protein